MRFADNSEVTINEFAKADGTSAIIMSFREQAEESFKEFRSLDEAEQFFSSALVRVQAIKGGVEFVPQSDICFDVEKFTGGDWPQLDQGEQVVNRA